MTEQMPPPTEQITPSAPPPNLVARIVARMSIMQMLVALVLVLFVWQWFDAHRQISGMQQELAQRLAEIGGDTKASQVLVAQSQEAVREVSAKVALLEARYAETQSQRAALETLYQQLSSSQDETALAEVEQMLLIAGQQLQFSANVKAALIAMQQADDTLKRMDRPALSGLRRVIGEDMDKLRSLPNVDISDINARLDGVIAAVDGLPLAQDARLPLAHGKPVAATPEDSAWQKLLREMWDDIRQLVRIENQKKQELPLLSPTQSFFLRENLKLRLLSARLALLARDETGFKHDLRLAQEWMSRYFDTPSAQSTQALTSLQKLRNASINMVIPDISDSLAAVRIYRTAHEKSAR